VEQDVIQELSQPAPNPSCHLSITRLALNAVRVASYHGSVRIIDPPERIAGPRVVLRRYLYPADGPSVHAAIAASHDHLRAWMPWAEAAPTDESVRAFLEPAARDFGGDSAANYGITLADSGQYVGGCGLHQRVGEGALEIGYWIEARHEGKGLITESVRLLTGAALRLPGVERLEIHCDEANARSAAVPARLGYRLDRIEPHAITARLESGRFMIWVVKAGEWAQQESNL
jgi:RimJ/RimL family protein N-acetyltransferase